MYRQPQNQTMNNLSNHLLTISEISNEVFGEAIESAYVVTIWQNEIEFQLDYNRFVFERAMAKDGAVLLAQGSFPVIKFKHLNINIEIAFS